MTFVIESIKGGVIVSCQAISTDSTYGPTMMTAFALAAKRGGAVGIRANSFDDVQAIKKATGLPVIGIWKRPGLDNYGHIITPTLEDAVLLEQAGSDIIALDVTDRPRPGDVDAVTLIKQIKQNCKVLVMADCVNVDQALRAEDAGVDFAGTTLAFNNELGPYKANLAVLEEFVKHCSVPVIAEGRYWDPEDVEEGFKIGAHSIVIGSAITRPWMITERYVRQSPRGKKA